jgi:hypothetical protein
MVFYLTFLLGAIPLCCSIIKVIVQSKHSNIFQYMDMTCSVLTVSTEHVMSMY